MSSNRPTRRKKSVWRQYRIELHGKRRSDGSLFVTSSNLPPFSAVLIDGKWEEVLTLLEGFLKANFGPVKDIRLIRDASELVDDHNDDQLRIPPAYVVAELTPQRAGIRK